MRLLRFFAGALAFAAVIGFFTATAQARSARSNNNRTGKTRLIDRDENDDKQKEKEKQKQAQEEAKKKAEEAKKQADEAKKKQVAQQPKPPQPAKPDPKPTKVAKKPAKTGAPAKDDDALEQEADKLWAEATGSFEKGELLPGVKALRQILADYDGTPAAQKAQDQLDMLLGNAEYGPQIIQAEADEQFGAMHYRQAWNKYRALLARYPSSEQAAAARDKLAEIDKNDLLSKSVYTDEELEDARLWYLAGNIHHENGRSEEALAAWRKVIEEYPGCRFATMAGQKLDEALGTNTVASNLN